MKVFLSYSNRDREMADAVQNELQKQGFEVVRLDDLPPGSDISAAIIKAIQNSDAVVVLLSKASSRSRWLDAEVAASFVAGDGEGPKRLIPVRIDKEASIPTLLQGRTWLDFSNPQERNQAGPLLARALRARLPEVDAETRAHALSVESRLLTEEQGGYQALYARANNSLRIFVLIGLLIAGFASVVAIAVVASHPAEQVVLAIATAGTAAATFVLGWLTGRVKLKRRR